MGRNLSVTLIVGRAIEWTVEWAVFPEIKNSFSKNVGRMLIK